MNNIINKLKQYWLAIVCGTAIIFMSGLIINDITYTSPVSQSQQKYVGSIKSDKFHYPDCRWAQNINPENEVWFSSREEALSAGYVPCQTCGP